MLLEKISRSEASECLGRGKSVLEDRSRKNPTSLSK